MFERLRAWLTRASVDRPTLAAAVVIPTPEPEKHPEFERLDRLYSIATDESAWRDLDARLIQAEAIEPFEQVWRPYVQMFARTYRAYLPDDSATPGAAEAPAWWIGAQPLLAGEVTKSRFTSQGAPPPRLRRAFLPALDECLGFIAQGEQHLQRRDAARSSAALIALELHAYLNDDYNFRNEVARGKWSVQLVSAVGDYRQAYHDMLQAAARLTGLIDLALTNYGKNNRADVYSAQIKQAYIAGSPMFSNSGTPINVHYEGIDVPATFHLTAAAATIGTFSWQLENKAFVRDYQAARYAMRKQRDLVDAAHRKAEYINADIDLQRDTHARAVKAAAAKILLACQPDGALNLAAQADRLDRALKDVIGALATRLATVRDGIADVLGYHEPLGPALQRLLNGQDVIDADVLQDARQWCLAAGSAILRRRKLDRVTSYSLGLRAQNGAAWVADQPLTMTVSPAAFGTGVDLRIVGFACVADDVQDDFWPVTISPPGVGHFTHADGSSAIVDQSDLAGTMRSIPSGPVNSVDPSRNLVDAFINLPPGGDWTIMIGASTAGRGPDQLRDLILHFQIAGAA